MISDNGPPYNSQEFQDFTKTYGFVHVPSSPVYPQCNGKAENTVKLAKGLLRKASESKNDPHLALLNWRNTPSEILGTLPAQCLFCHRTRTLLPTSVSLLKQELSTDTVPKLETQKAKQANYYNSTARELTELKEGDLVRMQPLKPTEKHKPWKLATVQSKVNDRSYLVMTADGATYRRYRRHLKQTNMPPLSASMADQAKTRPSGTTDPLTVPVLFEPNQPVQVLPAPIPGTPAHSGMQPTQAPDVPRYPTRTSGREVKKPKYLNDFITQFP